MIQIQQLKLQIPHDEHALKKKLQKQLGISEAELHSYRIVKKSLDARKKPVLFYVYTIEAEILNEKRIHRIVKRNKNIRFVTPPVPYSYLPSGKKALTNRPIIVGTGPAGLFCGYALAKMGYRPVLLERGASVEERQKDVQAFWQGGTLKEDSNVQFGEGGAGTFSDGKLNTLVHDENGRHREVLDIFCRHGAGQNILYDSKPHIGTDILTGVVKNIREDIIRMGGEVHFHAKVTNFTCRNQKDGTQISGVTVTNPQTGESRSLPAEVLVLAIGHSARDTFLTLREHLVPMEPKPFAVGVRVEHPQTMINCSQYGDGSPEQLPAAPYKLTAKLENGRGVYTFCMCPGGYVVNASSEAKRLAVNGMSYSKRSGENANSAVIVTVKPEDYGTGDVLAGMEFQRSLEEAAYREGKGQIPAQLFGDFQKDIPSTGPGKILPQMKGSFRWANVRSIFPEYIAESLVEGILKFDQRIAGYAREDAVISGVESRTSSPIRILRDETLQSELRGIFPCGEGAGYAGGITSAAMDGLKVAESVSQIFRPFDICD